MPDEMNGLSTRQGGLGDFGAASPSSTPIAIVGCGVIGRSWARLFANKGFPVAVFDPNPEVIGRFQSQAIADGTDLSHVTFATSLERALDGAMYVQESTLEDLTAKKDVFARLDRLARPDAIIASSTSALDVQDFAGELPGSARCMTVHPFNPPEKLPVVEILQTTSGTPEALQRAVTILQAAGQDPIIMQKFAPGYIGNRLQAAIIREALHLVSRGVTDVAGVDKAIIGALGPRWAALGIFGTNHTNADSGLAAYYERFWESYAGLMRDLPGDPPELSNRDFVEIERQVIERYAGQSVEDLCRFRDSVVEQLQKFAVSEASQ